MPENELTEEEMMRDREPEVEDEQKAEQPAEDKDLLRRQLRELDDLYERTMALGRP